MDENPIPESNQSQPSREISLKEQFTTVTPVSKFLAMVLFVALPFVGFWFGLNYQDTNTLSGESTVIPTSENEVALQETEGTDLTQRVADSANIGDDAFLERLRLEYPDFFSAPEDYSFEWRWRDSSGSISSPPNISKIQGKVLSTSEFSFQDLWLGEQSLLYQIENTLPSFFAQEGFTQATANDTDHPTNGSSVQGYERMSDGTVCLRIIEDTESEFLNYKIACGQLEGIGSTQPPSFSIGKYIEWEGKVSEYVQDCGGGENCSSYLRISLPENSITESVFEARIDIENCVDETLRGGETVKVTGRIQNVIPDIGLILSCADTKTSVTRK